MSVSYLSQTFSNSPYVAPLDLNVLAKVLTVKQGQFNENAQRIQGQVDAIGQLDVLKGEDREYLNGKLNNIVSSINGLGGVDLSDYNVTGQIEGLAGSVYGDEKVISAIASTKRARSLMSSYEKMKTDPKMKGMYSEVNETLDLEKVKAWQSDGQVGSSFNGPSSATPYVAYRDNHIKIFKGLVANKYTNISATGDPLYFSKEDNKIKTAEDIMEEARGLLSAEERNQLKRDAVYHVKYQAKYTPQELLGRYTAQQGNLIERNYQKKKSEYTANILATAADPAKRQKFEKALEEETTIYNQRRTALSDPKFLTGLFNSDPEELAYTVYSNDYFSALGNKFAVNESSRSLIFNQGEAFRQKQSSERIMFNERMKLEDAKLRQDDAHHKDNLAVQRERLAREGKKGTGAGGDEEGVALPIPGNNLDPDVMKNNEITPDKLTGRIAQGEIEIDDAITNLTESIFKEYPELQHKYGSNADKANARSVADILRSTRAGGASKRFELEDIQRFTELPEVQKMVQQGYFKKQHYDAFTKMWQQYQNPTDNTKLPAAFQPTLEKVIKAKEDIEFNKALINTVDAQVAREVGVSVDQLRELRKVNPKGQTTPFTNAMYAGVGAGGAVNAGNLTASGIGKAAAFGLSPAAGVMKLLNQEPTLLDKVEAAERKAYKEKASLPIYNKRSFVGLTKDDQEKEYGADSFRWLAETYKVKKGVAIEDPSTITFNTFEKSYDGKGYIINFSHGAGKDKVNETLQFSASDIGGREFLQNKLGINENPKSHIDDIVALNTTTIAYPVKTANKGNFAVNVRVVNPGQGSVAQFGFPKVPNPDPANVTHYDWHSFDMTRGMTPSQAYTQAVSFAQKWKGNHDEQPKEEFIWYLTNTEPFQSK